MHGKHNLREQVSSELKKRRYIFFTLLFLSIIYISINLVFNDTGLLRYLDLKEKEIKLNNELQQISQNNKNIRSAIESYKENEFYVEKHAREEFGLARPDEYIFMYDKKSVSPQ